MGLLDQILDAASVLFTELVEALALRLKGVRVLAKQQSVELLLLVALARLLDDNIHGKVSEQSFLELVDTVCLCGTLCKEVFEHLVALASLIRVALESGASLTDGWLQVLQLRGG